MNLLEFACLAVMLGILALGIDLLRNWETESRIAGATTLLGDGLAAYLFFTQWLPVRENTSYGLVVILLLSVAGYLAGLAISSLIRTDWFEDLLDLEPSNLSVLR